jgi:hypothetical protein
MPPALAAAKRQNQDAKEIKLAPNARGRPAEGEDERSEKIQHQQELFHLDLSFRAPPFLS